MRVAIVENTRHTDHGQVGQALAEEGASIDVFKPFESQALPKDMSGYDALVVFGGEQNARADDTHPYLPELVTLIRHFGDSGKAVLGICLGSQLLARAYGGENHIGTAPEFGWQGIEVTQEGADDPVIGTMAGGNFVSFQWHDDTFSLPPGAIHLAGNAAARHQAFRVGRAAYGTQFHFEANRKVVADWHTLFGDLIGAKRPDWPGRYAGELERHGQAADEAGLALARAWVARITE